MSSLIADARAALHKGMFSTRTLSLTPDGVATNADTSSKLSKAIAGGIVNILAKKNAVAVARGIKPSGQTLGKQFEQLVAAFLQQTFPSLQNIRPGKWQVVQLGNMNNITSSSFAQCEHLSELGRLSADNAQLAAVLGNDDAILLPDIVVYRELYEDSELNAERSVVDDHVCRMSDIRKRNGGKPVLHASVSVKCTMRSDHAQNSRTEVLNLIRNRRGHLPHIVSVTAEPLPGRIALLALGAGDMNCVYHFALDELVRAVQDAGSEESAEMLDMLMRGKCLKDISDLPLDLAV